MKDVEGAPWTECMQHMQNAGMKFIKTREAAKGVEATRNHAEAMTVEDIEAMVAWSESVCPKSAVDLVLAGSDQNAEHVILVIKHTFLRGFLSSGFTLWTRNNELCKLQHGDLTWNCRSVAPDFIEHFEVHLENRKGWQKKAGYDPHPTDNIYDIYPQPVHAMNMHYHLPVWISVYRHFLGGGRIDQDFYDTFLAPRWGPVPFHVAEGKQRWSLTIVCWWGGWAEDERVDTLMKYLMDSLQSYETGHGNALCPSRLEPAKSFMSDHSLDQPVTVNDFCRFADAMMGANQQVIDMLCAAPELSFVHMRHMSLAGTEAQGNALQPSPVLMQKHRRQKSIKERNAPIPSIIISDIPKHGEDLFLAIVKQWEEGDPSHGLVTPLKDWPVEWYTGTMRLVTGTKRSNRKFVADKYER
ncbi:hypothetical protein BDP27DRAFT_1384789 [Rhodocollybia butyracea]|uniref:Uncharacterized protein n=1 Tax=Rhodocollybia butyracea TaxID=206335 RepID=A0A9P5PLH0_9AGAR|nr:hypothetical protein BDP27DRAFT_1384789 [Rhodocollybia butyracea]